MSRAIACRRVAGALLALIATVHPHTSAAAGSAASRWSVTASAYTYVLPHGRDYVNPNVALDRGHAHVEARFDYEDLDTGSLWAGYNIQGGGSDLVYTLTPMAGMVFGHLNGLAPGYEIALAYAGLAFAGQGEYVFDAAGGSDDFFYAWNELSYAPVRWLRFGAAIQHTKAYATEVDVQRGPLLGFSAGRFDFTVYVFNVDKPDPPVVLGIVAGF